MGSEAGYSVVLDPVYGYRRLDPIPGEAELADFYRSRYYSLLRRRDRAPELSRLLAGGEEAESERMWLRETLYADIAHVLRQQITGRRILDIGCGTGEFLAYLLASGFCAAGIEPSEEAAAAGKAEGRPIECITLERYAAGHRAARQRSFHAVTMLNVLEHVRRPDAVVELTKGLLAPAGVLCVRVPNDFSEIQLAAQTQLQKPPWWVAAPDHVNYFDIGSLRSLLERFGFDILYTQTDFPMELFLLMGDDYTDQPDVGGRCHRKRVRFEMAISGELRRRLYRALAQAGIGRDVLMFAKVREA